MNINVSKCTNYSKCFLKQVFTKLKETEKHFTLFHLVLNVTVISFGLPFWAVLALVVAYKVDMPLFRFDDLSKFIEKKANDMKVKVAEMEDRNTHTEKHANEQ